MKNIFEANHYLGSAEIVVRYDPLSCGQVVAWFRDGEQIADGFIGQFDAVIHIYSQIDGRDYVGFTDGDARILFNSLKKRAVSKKRFDASGADPETPALTPRVFSFPIRDQSTRTEEVTMPQIGFVKAMKDFFGPLPGQTLMQFGAELKALSYEEKCEFARGLRSIGIDCADPDQPRAAA